MIKKAKANYDIFKSSWLHCPLLKRNKVLKELIERTDWKQDVLSTTIYVKDTIAIKKKPTIKRVDSYFRSVGKCFNEPLLVNSCFVEPSPRASVTEITRAVNPFNCISYQSCSSIRTSWSWLNLLTFYLIQALISCCCLVYRHT